MEAVIHLDTQIVVWLHLADRRRLRPVRKTLERFALEISPAVLLELEYLSEIGRTNYGADRVAAGLAEKIGLRVSDASFPRRSETRYASIGRAIRSTG
ncbi:MAG: hypothetical protein M5R36_09620 [Deltaproteobacteria bacterium]|nr:hypothetical protein [Deltaproteobacteria bacterium]